jgi:hypothetical protein
MITVPPPVPTLHERVCLLLKRGSRVGLQNRNARFDSWVPRSQSTQSDVRLGS